MNTKKEDIAHYEHCKISEYLNIYDFKNGYKYYNRGTCNSAYVKHDGYIKILMDSEPYLYPEIFTITGNGATEILALENAALLEEQKFFDLLLVASLMSNIPYIVNNDDEFLYTKEILEHIQYAVERNRLMVDTFLLNGDGLRLPEEFPDGWTKCDSDGISYSIWGVNLKELPKHNLNVLGFAITEPRYLGSRQIQSVDTTNTIDGYSTTITGTMSIVNTRAVSSIVRSSALKYRPQDF